MLAVQTLADVYEYGLRLYDARELLRRGRDRERRNRKYNKLRIRCARHIGRDLDAIRDDNARQQLFIAAFAVQQVAFRLLIGPRGHLMAVLMQQHRQRDAPAAGAQYKNLHFAVSSQSDMVFLLLKENLFSFPRMMRPIFERCMNTTTAAMPSAIAVSTGSR